MKGFSLKTYLLVFLLVVLSNNAFCQDNSDEDDRMKIRLGFTSVNNIHRQILVTVDSNATQGIDYGYDAENLENHIDDMYWMIENRRFLIQGTDVIDATTILPLGLHTDTSGTNIISIESLINVPEDLEIGILDKETNTYYDIKKTLNFSIHLPAGEYLNRFELKFIDDNGEDDNDTSNEVDAEIEEENGLDNEVFTEDTPIELSYINRIKSISIKNIGHRTIKSVKVYNVVGQQITEYNNINAIDQTLIKAYNLNTGNYILIAITDLGIISKKVSVR